MSLDPLASVSLRSLGSPSESGRAVSSARRRFSQALRDAYAPPAMLLDEANCVIAVSGDLSAYLRAEGAAPRDDAFTRLRDDVVSEVRDVVARARAAGRAASGLVILLRDGPLACRPVATPLGSETGAYVSVAFETPLKTLAAGLVPPTVFEVR